MSLLRNPNWKKYENMPREEKYELENNLHGARKEVKLLDQDWG